MFAFFDPPTWGFNFISFWLSIVGTLVGTCLGVWGLLIAFIQLRKTLDAANAARSASEETTRNLSRLAMLIDVHKLAGLAAGILASIRHKEFAIAAYRAQDLRNGLAALRNAPESHRLKSEPEWSRMITTLSEMQKELENADGDDGERPDVRLRCTEIMRYIDEQLHAMSGRASHLEGK